MTRMEPLDRDGLWLGPDSPWPGAWAGGVDLRVEGQPVFAVHISGDDIKRDWELVGPLDLDDPGQRALLNRWAESVLGRDGGYVHLSAATRLEEVELTDEEYEEETE